MKKVSCPALPFGGITRIRFQGFFSPGVHQSCPRQDPCVATSYPKRQVHASILAEVAARMENHRAALPAADAKMLTSITFTGSHRNELYF